MNLFPNGIIKNSDDFDRFTVKGTLNNVERWLNESPFQSQMYNCPKGSGKTTLIKYLLSEDKRKKLATEKKLLIKDCPLSTSFLQDAAGIFCCIIDAITDSISIMDKEDYEWFKEAFNDEMKKDSFADFRNDKDDAYDLIKSLTAILKSKGYYIVLLIDDFHLLTCSSSCDTNTFNNMAYLHQKSLLSYIVLSNYHVSVGSQAYCMSEFERIFGDNFHTLPKMKNKHKPLLYQIIHTAIKTQQEIDELEPEELFDISEEELDLIMNLTDGIPGMVQNAVNAYYDARQAKDGDAFTSNEFMNVVFEGCKPLMREWIHYLKDTSHWETLRIIFDKRKSSTTTMLERDKDQSPVLTDTGLLLLDPLRGQYKFTCPVFERFVAEELKRPFYIPSETDKLLKALENQDVNTVNITIDNSVIDNSTIDNSTKNTLTVENTIIVPGLTASGILQLLNSDADFIGDVRLGYASALAKKFGEIQRKPLPQALSGGNEDAIDLQIEQDAVFDEFGSQILQNVNVDDNQDLIDVTPTELETLDKRFNEVRGRNIRSALTDSFLNALSERCQFYLKLSVVVEDALSFINMDDFSPQLVLYGKALEQTLKDNFYELFHSDSTLSSHRVESGRTFLDVSKEKSFISSYQFIIQDNANYLSRLAEDNQIRFHNKNLTSVWWRELKDEIHKARLIRNMADHAGVSSPKKENVDSIFSYLVGNEKSEGILRKSKVGIYLMNMLTTGDSSVSELLAKDSCVVTITEIKPDGRMQGAIDDCTIAVKISHKKIHQFLLTNPDAHFEVGMKLYVKLLQYSNNDTNDFFIAKILSV